MKTRDAIIEAAARLFHTVGSTAFSYADIARAVSIRKASVHHHFPTKDDLVAAVIARAAAQSVEWASGVAGLEPVEQLRAFLATYRRLLDAEGEICTAGAIGGDIHSLGSKGRAAGVAYLTALRGWLRHTYAVAGAEGPDHQATTTMATLQGGLQLARSLDDPGALLAVVDDLERRLKEL